MIRYVSLINLDGDTRRVSRVAESRCAMPVYSHSRIETFETCPLKYKFKYVDGIRKEEESVEAFWAAY